MKDDIAYTPTTCFEPFAFPTDWKTNLKLEELGRIYNEFRAGLMIQNDEGLTETYNRFHDPNEDSADIQRLRELHDAMDRAVLDSYGWHKIQPVCEFFPEFDEEDDDENGRPKRKKYRYRWPEAIHDEVLALLLDLNRQRAEEERREAEDQPVTWENGATANTGTSRRKRSAKSDTMADKPSLFNSDDGKE